MIQRCHTLICTVMYLISRQVTKWLASKVIVQSSSCVQHVKHLPSRLLTLVVLIHQVHISLWYAAQSLLTFAHIDFKDRDDWRYIKYSFRSRNADSATVDTIHENRGVHWSALNYLPGWMPARRSVIEFMHAVFLCKFQGMKLQFITDISKVWWSILIGSSSSSLVYSTEWDLSSQWADLRPFFQGLSGQSKQIAYRLQSVCYLLFIVRIIIWFIAFNWQGIT
jgi:hypothetical protein